MTKSIVSGGVVLVAVVVIVLGLFGVYDLSDAGLLSWGAVGMIATILFAAFGGFKPFFATAEPEQDTLFEQRQPVDHSQYARVIRQDHEETDHSADTMPTLISVGADQETTRRRSLFEAKPESEANESDSHRSDSVPHQTLFSDVLGERLAQDRPVESAENGGSANRWKNDDDPGLDGDDGGVVDRGDGDRNDADRDGVGTSPGDDPDSADVVDEDGPASGIVVDENPAWVDSDEQDDTASEAPATDALEHVGEPDIAGADEVDELLETQGGPAEERDLGGAVGASETEGVAPEVDTPSGIDAPTTQLPATLAPPPAIELHAYSSDEVMTVVKAQERDLVETLIGEGLLTTEGPITDRDVRTMVFVAVSSTELIEVLTASLDGGVDGQHAGPAALEEGHESS